MYIPSKTVKYFIFKNSAIFLNIFEETYHLDFSPIWESVCSSSSDYATRLRVPGSNSDRDKRDFLLQTSRLALGPAQPPIQYVPQLAIGGKSSRSVKLSTHLHLVPRLRMVEQHLFSSYVPSWRGHEKLCFTFSLITSDAQ